MLWTEASSLVLYNKEVILSPPIANCTGKFGTTNMGVLK